MHQKLGTYMNIQYVKVYSTQTINMSPCSNEKSADVS